MAPARPFPPSSQRIADARASGHLPRAPLVGFASALVLVLAAGLLVGPRLMRACHQLLRTCELAAAGQSSLALRTAGSSVRELVLLLVGGLALGFVGIGLACWLAQGPSFARLSSARPLSFGRLSPGRTARALWSVGLLLLALLTLSEWASLASETLLPSARAFALRLGLLTLACLFIDVALARASFWASIRLTRRESLDEQREAFGAPEVRAARERLRHELREPT